MGKKFSILLAILVVTMFSVQCFAAGPKVGRPPQVTIEDLKGVWDVTVKELLIVGDLDPKKEINPATIEFDSSNDPDPMKGEFTLSKTAGILLDFKATCSMAKRGAKIFWHIENEEAIEDNLKDAISAWVLENNIKLIGDPVLDIRSYAYKPIVVVKKTASPHLGIFQVKGSVKMTIDDGNGGQITEGNNFKYQCNFKFGSKDLVNSAIAEDEEGLDE